MVTDTDMVIPMLTVHVDFMEAVDLMVVSLEDVDLMEVVDFTEVCMDTDEVMDIEDDIKKYNYICRNIYKLKK